MTVKKNRKVFDRLYQEYYAVVRKMCLGYTKGDDAAADDLSQEVFMNAWGALDKFRGDSSYKTWIYRITVNTCLLHIRSEQRRAKRMNELVEETTVVSETPKDGEFNSLYKAIGMLEKLDRLVIMMVLDQLSYEEIAKVSGISEGNLRVKIHRIKKRLKTHLEYVETHG
ncbi:RNA polymerase sigma factor [Roseivirga sp. BDSF3-8]|uniref:RNA polymerase sigma factor n=1 Tax=Roseivirga sp. BDSF3-8 TaxID=3241598 RepID=UPI0035322F78